MSITGHKTEHTFERYNISDVDDREAAVIKAGEYAAQQTKAASRAWLWDNLSRAPGRYRLTVRTEPSQGSNPGSIPGIATK